MAFNSTRIGAVSETAERFHGLLAHPFHPLNSGLVYFCFTILTEIMQPKE
jgi:hypothetical protein